MCSRTLRARFARLPDARLHRVSWLLLRREKKGKKKEEWEVENSHASFPIQPVSKRRISTFGYPHETHFPIGYKTHVRFRSVRTGPNSGAQPTKSPATRFIASSSLSLWTLELRNSYGAKRDGWNCNHSAGSAILSSLVEISSPACDKTHFTFQRWSLAGG